LALQQHLGFGQWLRWLVDRLPYSPRSAQAYISLAVWAEEFEDDFEAFAHLGIAKLQLLAALPASRRARFGSGGTFAIPGSGERKRLEVMTYVELKSITAGIGGLQAVPPALPASKILQRFAHRTAGLDALADELRARAGELEVEEVREVVQRLSGVVEELEGAFGL
jgi:hypothetical protein